MSERNYRWELRGGSRKDICPCCGQRRFVPYVSVRDHVTPAGAEYGRCDREQNCGYHHYPSQVKPDNSLPCVKMPERKKIRFYASSVFVSTDSNLFGYAVCLLGYEAAERVWQRYHISAFGNATVFWQISKGMDVRAGKAIAYSKNGHRIKDTKFPVWWLHKCPQYNGSFTGDEIEQCFFGEHLLAHDEYVGRKVAIVESEKTAAFMSELRPEYLWLACGGSCCLKNKDKNKVLNGRDVVLFPDNGMYDKWLCIANENGWDCSREMEQRPVFEGCDILDYEEKQREDLL